MVVSKPKVAAVTDDVALDGCILSGKKGRG
jgi:hypothetical protein